MAIEYGDNKNRRQQENAGEVASTAPGKVEKLDPLVIEMLIAEDKSVKIYLDNLHDLIARQVKLLKIAGAEIVGEASGIEENIFDELERNVILKKGYDFWRNPGVGTTIRRVEPSDLERYHFYFKKAANDSKSK